VTPHAADGPVSWIAGDREKFCVAEALEVGVAQGVDSHETLDAAEHPRQHHEAVIEVTPITYIRKSGIDVPKRCKEF